MQIDRRSQDIPRTWLKQDVGTGLPRHERDDLVGNDESSLARPQSVVGAEADGHHHDRRRESNHDWRTERPTHNAPRQHRLKRWRLRSLARSELTEGVTERDVGRIVRLHVLSDASSAAMRTLPR